MIQGRQVAGMHPAAGIDHHGGLLGLAPISAHHGIAAGTQLAAFATRHDAALFVDDLDLDMRQHPADGGDPPL